jgi:hypothetical protein
MKSFELKFTLPPGTSALSKLPALIQANVFQALVQGMVYAQTISQEKYLSGPRPERLGVVTGLLKSGIKGGAQLGGGSGIFAIGVLRAGYGGAAVKYAAIHEYGGTTSPHTITPRTKTTLKFFWKKANIWRYAKSINHPGSVIPARPYLSTAMVDSLPKIERLIQSSIDRAYKDS